MREKKELIEKEKLPTVEVFRRIRNVLTVLNMMPDADKMTINAMMQAATPGSNPDQFSDRIKRLICMFAEVIDECSEGQEEKKIIVPERN
jgi:hypothetical protein